MTSAPDAETQGSEFGAGVVVCLAKFAEHLANDQAVEIWKADWWLKNPQEHARIEREAAKFPHGDCAAHLRAARSLYADIHGSKEAALSHRIRMWMNGASDHFYDLDKERAPQPLRELAELALRIGHGFTDEQWTMETVERIRELWKQSCLAVDRMLGVEKPDWGQW